jgi:cytochrome b6-f complex iron-sulfur subunit
MSCTRRTLLHGIGVAVAGSIVASCGGGSGDVVDAGPPDAGACPANDLCLDITKAPNTALANVNGSVVVTATTGKLVVVRTSATAVAVLSAICTHQGCTVNFVSTTQHLFCPCHGAEFTLTGAVAKSPATVPLKVYTATLSGSIITIKLA